MSNKIGSIVMTWRYSPSGYLGDLDALVVKGYEIVIFHDVVKVSIPAHLYDGTTDPFNEVKEILEKLFNFAMVANNSKYSISCKSINNYPGNGTEGVVLWPQNCVSASFAESVAIKQYDKDGRLIYDHEEEGRKRKEQEIQMRKELAYKLAYLGAAVIEDPTAIKIVGSYKASLDNYQYALVHLYEIRDALKTHFKHKKAAIKALNITKNDWDRIGDLSNSRAVKGSRHEGTFLEPLSELSESLVKEAQKAAQKLVLAYFEYCKNRL
jgi:hypothetical protein